jgi:beta-lactamase regulating signal transducer with metallopeptidase domain
VFSSARFYGNCSCAFSAACISPTGIYNYPSPQNLLDIPGFYTGCFIIESLLQSNLQCVYNQTFINQLQTYLVLPFAMNVTALDATLPSQYSPNTAIDELLDTLMIEEWNLTQMYDQYFNECQPIQCSYSIEARNDIIYIVTTVIGIIGGLVTVLKLVIPRLVMVVRKKRELQASSTGKTVIEKTLQEYFV